MRKITEIIVHCSATEAGKYYTAADIDHWHRQQGWRSIGYHYVVRLDGTIEKGRPESEVGAHCYGHNAHSIGVCYIGGLITSPPALSQGEGANEVTLVPADTRTPQQKAALSELIRSLKMKYPQAVVLGHRDTGASKACPCFNAKAEYAVMLVLALILMFLLSSCRAKEKVMNVQKGDSLSFHQSDSVSSRLNFTFDQLDYWLQVYSDTLIQNTDSVPLLAVRHVRIKNGRFEADKDSVTISQSDYKSAVTEKQSVRIRSDPCSVSKSVFFFIVFSIILICVFLFKNGSRGQTP